MATEWRVFVFRGLPCGFSVQGASGGSTVVPEPSDVKPISSLVRLYIDFGLDATDLRMLFACSLRLVVRFSRFRRFPD